MYDTILNRLNSIFGEVHFIQEVDEVGEISHDIPFIIKHGLQGSPVLQKWNFEFFACNYGHIRQDISTRFNRDIISGVTISEFINNYIFSEAADDEQPYYLKAWEFLKDAPELSEDICGMNFFENWLSLLPDEVISECEYKLLFLGKKGSSFNWHYDSLMVNSWSGLIKGKKIWLYIPAEFLNQIDKVNHIDFIKDGGPVPKTDLPVYVGLQNEGDIAYTSSGWLHHVINLENTISVTENFINGTNIDKVIAYLGGDNCRKYEKLSQEKIDVLKGIFRQVRTESVFSKE